ncbi:autotransporter outer membrane beta-barrel domain-containing protein [Bradyrhizobium sp. 1]|uniref:autotransporter outer membrane beta-barrel domain-containing protein n=1 Tax=Bradyrhizobium sp. 1 TaxID=241591 RepID=UPI001FF9BA76|nr:autotransporter outer membrane beta-barrel domain-containing protein [Bradyrhizobium sp. 1]MCK1391003.1 hypothetical protein [Bradyrhizobium sp. 1]
MKLGFFRHGFAVALLAVLSLFAVRPAAAQSGPNIPQEVINNVIQNIIQNVRDQIQHRRVIAPPGTLRFSGEEANFDNRDPFASKGVSNPFSALAYAKAPPLAAPPPAAWLYGVNLVGSGDRAQSTGVDVSVATVTGAVDVTKIGIFTATDALTFIGTGSHSWAHSFSSLGGAATITDGSIPSTSGTLSYINGGFSADFTTLASWTHNTTNVAVVGVAGDASGLAYTLNGQYRFDFPYTVWIEPTAGVTYSESYTGNFGTKTGDSTEVHGGARAGFETKWLGYTVQPSISGQYYEIVDASGAAGAVVVGGVPFGGTVGTYGVRGSGKINVLWTPQLSSYLEVHGSSITAPKTGLPAVGGAGTSIVGTQAGLRYTW